MLTSYNENKCELKKLFKEIFHEEDSFTNIIFEKKLSQSHIFTIKENEKIVAIAYGIPTLYKTDNILKNCVYIYGVGVTEEHRGKGYAKKIMEEIADFYKSKNVSFLYLVPATNKLFSMYEKMGFTVPITLSYKNFDLENINCVPYEIKSGDLKEDYKKYIKEKNNVILRSDSDNEILLSYLKYKKINESGFLYYTKDDYAVVRECFHYNKNDLDGFLSYLKEKSIKKVQLFCENEKDFSMNYALIKKYEKINFKKIYTTINFD